jgi:hypothetical protein
VRDSTLSASDGMGEDETGAGSTRNQPATEPPSEQAQALQEPSKLPPEEDSLEAFGDLSQYNPIRRCCIVLMTNPDFEFLVLLAILANCVTLSLYRPLEPDDSSWNMKLFWAGRTALYAIA